MSSISATGSNQYAYTSPLQQLDAELQSEVSAGTISSSDETALSSALTSINDSLTSGQSSSSSSSSTSSSGDTGPGDIKSKITSLIQAQVSSGALTSSQATELQNLFTNTFANGPGGAAVRVDLVAPAVLVDPAAPVDHRPAPLRAAVHRGAAVHRRRRLRTAWLRKSSS